MEWTGIAEQSSAPATAESVSACSIPHRDHALETTDEIPWFSPVLDLALSGGECKRNPADARDSGRFVRRVSGHRRGVRLSANARHRALESGRGRPDINGRQRRPRRPARDAEDAESRATRRLLVADRSAVDGVQTTSERMIRSSSGVDDQRRPPTRCCDSLRLPTRM